MFNYNNNQKFLSNRTFSHNFINIKQNKINNNFLKKNLEKEKFFKIKKNDDKIHFFLSNKIIKFDLDAHSNNSEKINENFIKNYNTINKKRSESDKINNHKILKLDNNNSNPNILNENKSIRNIFPKKFNDYTNRSVFYKKNLNNNIYSYNFYKNEKKNNNIINNGINNYNKKDNNNNKLKIDVKIPFENIFLQNKLKKFFNNNNNNEYRKVIKLKSKNNKLKVNISL